MKSTGDGVFSLFCDQLSPSTSFFISSGLVIFRVTFVFFHMHILVATCVRERIALFGEW